MPSFVQQVAGLSVLASYVAAHGQIVGLEADGVFHIGYSPNSMANQKPPPQVIEWNVPDLQNNGPVMPDKYGAEDIICQINATPGQLVAPVTAGTNVTVFWTSDWPVGSHHGPMIDYLAPCPGNDCTTADKTALKFFKIDEAGLLDASSIPGVWGTDEMHANNVSWTLQIPASIAPGQYVLRHEAIALHEAAREGGAQNYPFCLNLDVQGTGTETPEGIVATELYTPTDPGLLVDIFKPLTDYTVPGPPVFTPAT